MGTVVECDPFELASRARAWLEGDPVLHNVICTVLARATAEPDRFREAGWFAVEEDSDPVGVAIITPPFLLGLTPMSDSALAALVEVLAERRPHLPGAGGPRDVASRFAGLWRERTGAGVTPGMEQQLYRLDAVVVPPPAPGSLRPAGEDDRLLLREWFAAFVAETGAISGDTAAAVDRWLALGGLHLWEDGPTVTMTGAVPAVAGVVRVGPVYTPPELRGRGYASNCVAAVSRLALERGASACMLYTDAANPTSNAIYRRLGYRRVADAREYRFSYT
jgi:predicted GNAT family acetyltransferase